METQRGSWVRALMCAALGLLAALLLHVSLAGAAAGSIQIALDPQGTGAAPAEVPAGTVSVTWAYMPRLSSAGSEIHYTWPRLSPSATFTPPPGDPVVAAIAVNSEGHSVGSWAERVQTSPVGANPGENGPSSIEIALLADKTGAQPTAEPAGTAYVHWAYMPRMTSSGSEVHYATTGLTGFTPPPEDPVVDALAMDSNHSAIGTWAGRIQTTPAGGGSKEPPAEEPPVEKPPVEEPPAEEPPAEGTQPAMTIALDVGGWAWESAVKDEAGAVKHFRSSYSNFNSDSQVEMLARNGVQLMPLFNGSPTASAAELANKVVSWFARYGHGGTFWRGKPVDRGATTAEIVNEPGNPYFWGSGARTDQQAYAQTIEAVAAKVASLPNRPRLLVSFDGGFEGDQYGRALIAADPHLLKLGLGWTVHPYGGHGSGSALGNRARVTETYAATHQPIYVTEVGWPTDTSAGPTGDSLQWSEAQQASNIVSFVAWASSLHYVADVTYFNYADYGPNNWYGIVNANGTVHKLSYDTLIAASTLYGH